MSPSQEHVWDAPALAAGTVTAVIWLCASTFGGAFDQAGPPGIPVPTLPRPAPTEAEPTWPPPTSAPRAHVVVPWKKLDARFSTIPVEPGGDASNPTARFADVGGSVTAAKGGGFVVTLTAHGRAVSLDPCPDFLVDDERYGLDCAGVPYRDRHEAPFLPSDRAVSFVIDVPSDGGWWELGAPQGPRLALPEEP